MFHTKPKSGHLKLASTCIMKSNSPSLVFVKDITMLFADTKNVCTVIPLHVLSPKQSFLKEMHTKRQAFANSLSANLITSFLV